MKATFIAVLLFMAYTTVSVNDASVAPEPRPVEVYRVRDPMDPPRCPKVNAAGQPLLSEVAMRSDGGEWTHACEYESTTFRGDHDERSS